MAVDEVVAVVTVDDVNVNKGTVGPGGVVVEVAENVDVDVSVTVLAKLVVVVVVVLDPPTAMNSLRFCCNESSREGALLPLR